MSELIEFIIARYHASLRRELPGLIEAARGVERVHAEDPSCPRGLASHLERMDIDVREHLAKEEQVLFPAILSGRRGAQLQMPIRAMMHEHDDHAANLRRLRELATDFAVPPEADTTWRALYEALEGLELELMEHISLENTVLFPRALAD